MQTVRACDTMAHLSDNTGRFMPLFHTRLTPREFTVALAERLQRSVPAASPGVAGPLRITLWQDDAGPYIVNATRAFQAYQRWDAELGNILDETAAAITERLLHTSEDASWEEAQRSVYPWLLPPTHPDAARCVHAGTVGALIMTYVYESPLRPMPAYAVPDVWGIARDVLHHRAVANLRAAGQRVQFLPVLGNSAVWRLAPCDRWTASRLLLPEVQRAINNHLGGAAAVFLAAPDTVFVSATNLLGEPPASLLNAARDTCHAEDFLSPVPLRVQNGQLAAMR